MLLIEWISSCNISKIIVFTTCVLPPLHCWHSSSSAPLTSPSEPVKAFPRCPVGHKSNKNWRCQSLWNKDKPVPTLDPPRSPPDLALRQQVRDQGWQKGWLWGINPSGHLPSQSLNPPLPPPALKSPRAAPVHKCCRVEEENPSLPFGKDSFGDLEVVLQSKVNPGAGSEPSAAVPLPCRRIAVRAANSLVCLGAICFCVL